MSVVLKELLADSRDGEWGQAEPGEDSVEMAVVRGTDFADVSVGEIGDVPVRHIPSRIAARKTLQPWDILLETAGGSKDRPTGRTLLVRPSHIAATGRPMTCASFARFLRINPERAEPRYIYWLLQHLYASNVLRKYHTQHTGVARFQYTTFAESEPLQLPERPAQHRIADVLCAYEDLVENNTRRIKMLEEMARSLYRDWFVDFHFPGREKVKLVESKIGKVPHGWRLAAVSDIADVNQRSIRRGSAPEYVDYVDISSVSTGRIHKSERFAFQDAPGRARRLVRHGDTIWSMVRPNRRSHALVVDPLDSMVVSTGFAVLSPHAVPPSFLYLATSTDTFVSYLVSHARGAAYPAVSGDDFAAATLLVPSEDVLQGFGTVVDPFMRQIEVLRRASVAAGATRDLLLPRLLAGEIELEP